MFYALVALLPAVDCVLLVYDLLEHLHDDVGGTFLAPDQLHQCSINVVRQFTKLILIMILLLAGLQVRCQLRIYINKID